MSIPSDVSPVKIRSIFLDPLKIKDRKSNGLRHAKPRKHHISKKNVERNKITKLTLKRIGTSAMCSNDVYHEKQVRELCALHALNNLFQSRDAFTKLELDVICHSLSPNNWINPHKSVLGLGNYDINVIMKALQSRGCETIWFDKRKDPSCLNFKNICGYILNVPSEYKISFITIPLRRRHWITIRQLNGTFYNLDSKLDAPQVIGREQDLLNYLKEELDCRDKELFLVVTNEVGTSQGWLRDQTSYSNNMPEREAEVLQLKDITSDGVKITINPLCNKNEQNNHL